MLDQILQDNLPEVKTTVTFNEESVFHFLVGTLAVLIIAFCIQKLIK